MGKGQQEIQEGIHTVQNAKLAFHNIVDHINEVTDQIQDITASAEEMSASSEEINSALINISSISQNIVSRLIIHPNLHKLSQYQYRTLQICLFKCKNLLTN